MTQLFGSTTSRQTWILEVYTQNISSKTVTSPLSGAFSAAASALGDSLELPAFPTLPKTEGPASPIDSLIGGATKGDETVSLIASNLDTISKDLFDYGLDWDIEGSGLRGVTINRSKDTAEHTCSMDFVGPLDTNIQVGSWIVANTFTRDPEGSSNNMLLLPRFIGQVFSIDTSFSVNETGNLVQVSTVSSKSWSSLLTIHASLDLASYMSQTAPGVSSSLNRIQEVILATVNSGRSITNLQKLGEAETNIFEFSALCLLLIGALGENNPVLSQKSPGLKSPDQQFGLPSIPVRLLVRMGMSESEAALISANPFAGVGGKSFISYFFGIQDKPINNTIGSFNGVYDSLSSIDEYSSSLNKDARPPKENISSLISQLSNTSAWDLIEGGIDSQLHEIFADIIYFRDEDTGRICARPSLFVRDRPKLIKELGNLAKKEISGYKISDKYPWTNYDDLQKININSNNITSFSLSTTSVNTFTHIRSRSQNETSNSNLQKLDADLTSVKKYDTALLFGWKPILITTQFYDPDSLIDWAVTARSVFTAWYGYNYLLPSAQISLKDDNSAITLGSNIVFDFGLKGNTFCGHVESIRTAMAIDPSGLEHTEIYVSLSMLTIVKNNRGDVTFIPQRNLGDLNSMPLITNREVLSDSPLDALKQIGSDALSALV